MPYTPPPPPDWGPAAQRMLADQEVRQLLAQAEADYGSAAATAGASTTAVDAVATGGVVELGGDVAVLGATPPGATVAVVAVSSYTLAQGIRQIPGWDNTWKHFGANLFDEIAGIGGHHGVDSETKLYVADYVQHRFIAQRQREAAVNSWMASQTVRMQHQLNAVARDLAKVNKAAHNADKQVVHAAQVAANNAKAAAVSYANARAHNVGVASMAYTDKSAAAGQRYAHDIAAQAQRNAQAHADGIVSTLRHDIPALIAAPVAAAVAVHVKGLATQVQQLRAQVDKLQQENDTCTEPMCEVVGPKSDWGKLLKKFGPAAIFAMLAAIAAEHPDEVAKVAADLGNALGPVLESAIAASLIPLGPQPVKQPGDVTGALGHLPFGL